MKGRNPVVRLLVSLFLGALLLAGLTVATPTQELDALSGDPPTTSVEHADEAVIEDDVALLAARKVRIRATRFIGIPFLTPPTNKIIVDVNPTLPGQKSYRVILKVRHQGTWQRCAVKQTRNRSLWEGFAIGRRPHEVAVFWACKNKPTRTYRVIVPAQHGFARTVVTPQNLLPNQD